MKKIALLTMVLISSISFSQSIATEQETIDWIKEKLQKHLISTFVPRDARLVHFKSITVNEINSCEIKITYEYGGLYGSTYQYIIPVDNKLSINERSFQFNADKIRSIDLKDGTITYTSWTNFTLRQGEDDLRNRVLKAIAHLATFCPKKEEKF